MWNTDTKYDISVETGIGTRDTYAGIIRIATFMYTLFFMIFIFIGHFEFAAIAAIFVIINVSLIHCHQISFPFWVVTEHIQILIIATFGVINMGWQYGFQLVLLLGIALNYFAPYNRRIKAFFLPLAELLLYIYLYLNYASAAPTFALPLVLVYIIHGSIMLGSCFLIIYATQKADLFTLINNVKASHLTEKLLSMATCDELTRLHNRRSMQEILDNMWSLYLTEERHFYIVICDIDNFKHINDTYGHAGGDIILKNLADSLQHSFRRSDFVSRWGGDEFLIAVPDIESPAAVFELVERVRLSVAQKPFCLGGHTVDVTMTFGIASCAGKLDLREVIMRADEQLYRGKNTGRNISCLE